jgi:hypothetical protein
LQHAAGATRTGASPAALPPVRPLDERLRLATCAHEAGHAAYAFELGWRINRLSALPEADGFADVEPLEENGLETAIAWVQMYLVGDAWLRVLLADDPARYGAEEVRLTPGELVGVPVGGNRAERRAFAGLVDYRQRLAEHPGNDLDEAERVAREVAGSSRAALMLVNWCALEVANRVEARRFQAIAGRLTELLERYGELDGDTATTEAQRAAWALEGFAA